MGNAGSLESSKTNSIFRRLFSNKEVRILMVGLDCAGKTTILYNMKMGKVVRTIPTIGLFVYFLHFIWQCHLPVFVFELCIPGCCV